MIRGLCTALAGALTLFALLAAGLMAAAAVGKCQRRPGLYDVPDGAACFFDA